MKFKYRFVDDSEIAEGALDAPNAMLAALRILGENARFARHSVRERDVSRIPPATELVELTGWSDNAYSLHIEMVGTRKRIPFRLFA